MTTVPGEGEATGDEVAGDAEALPFPAGCPSCGSGEHVRLISVGPVRPVRRCSACDVLWAVPRRPLHDGH